jgi:hypothetical protein
MNMYMYLLSIFEPKHTVSIGYLQLAIYVCTGKKEVRVVISGVNLDGIYPILSCLTALTSESLPTHALADS